LDRKKLKNLTALIINKMEKNYSSTGYNLTLRRNPSDLAEVRNVLKIASNTLPGHKIYFENMYEKAGFPNFYQSDTLDVLKHILELLK
jgi:hypothetical protein